MAGVIKSMTKYVASYDKICYEACLQDMYVQ